MNRNRILGLMLAVALLAGAVAFTAPAEAQLSSETFTIFYSDASYTEVVGERGRDCWGRPYRWGVITPYAELYSVPCLG